MDWGAVATIGSSLLNLISDQSTNGFNANLNAENREWQSSENALNRSWQTTENANSRAFTKRENQLGRDWEEKMWNLQNQYNSPSAMMARYREAGLNPFLNTQVGQGAGAASPVSTPNTSSTAPIGSPGVQGAPSAIPMRAPKFDLAGALGVSANIANQNANTLKTKWDVYNSILENGDRETAKRFLHANPDMMSDADPENSIYFKRWKRSDRHMELDNLVKDTQGWLLARYGDQEHQKALAEADARIENIVSQMNERDANIALLTEQLNTELEKQFNLHASGVESYANAETTNQLRKWVLNKLILETGIAGYTFNREKVSFDSEEELRAWLTSDEGKEAIKDMEKNGMLTNPSLFFRYLYQALDHLPLSGGASVTKHVK